MAPAVNLKRLQVHNDVRVVGQPCGRASACKGICARVNCGYNDGLIAAGSCCYKDVVLLGYVLARQRVKPREQTCWRHYE